MLIKYEIDCETKVKLDFIENLSCGHQNNLLMIQSDGKKSKPGVCPKGCNNTKVLAVKKIDPQVANIEVAESPADMGTAMQRALAK